jgi:GTP pyrophosphokinase
VLGTRFERALLYATRTHALQTRKGTEIPYVAHLLGVASIVLDSGGSEDAAIAALLHDAVEDQGGVRRLNDIQDRFGKRVATIVAKCSDADTVPKPPWRERKADYIAHLVSEGDSDVLLVGAADKLNNARAIQRDYEVLRDDLWARFNAGKQDQLWYYTELVKALGHNPRAPKQIVSELEAVIARLRSLCSSDGTQGT